MTENQQLDLAVSRLLDEYIEQIRAIMQLAKFTSEQASQLDNTIERLKSQLLIDYPWLDESTAQALSELSIEIEKLSTSRDISEEQSAESKNSIFAKLDTLHKNATENSMLGESLPELLHISLHSMASKIFPSTDLLFPSLLVSLVSTFETFISELFLELYSRFPLAMSEKAQFSWKGVASAQSLEELRSKIIERTVTTQLFDDFDAWIQHFESKFGIGVPKNFLSDGLKEIFLRRNLAVHSGLRVNPIYLDKVRLAGEHPEVGEKLIVDYSYIEFAYQHLSVLGFVLSWQIAHKILEQPSLGFFEDQAANTTYKYLLEGKYDSVHQMTSVLSKAIPVISEDVKLIMQINGWLSLKRLGRFDECRNDVSTWQTSTLAARFQLAQLALLDELDKGLALAQQIRGTKELSIVHWLSWPLLEEIRNHEDSKTSTTDIAILEPMS